MCLSSEYTTPRPESFASHAVADVDAALHMVAERLITASRRAHKSRCDLDALHGLTGERFAQVEAVPDGLYDRWRNIHAIQSIELLPQRLGSGTSVGEDSVVLLLDEYAAAKGLPHNELASRLVNACGLSSAVRPRGDAFLCRLREADGVLSLGGEVTAEMMGETGWLEKARRCARYAGDARVLSTLRVELQARLATLQAAPVSAVTAPAGPPAEPTEPAAAIAPGLVHWENGLEAEVLARVAVPASTRAKHVACAIKKEWLRLEVATMPAGEAVLVDDRLFYSVEAAESSWALEDGDGGARWLTLCLQKEHENMRWLDLTRRDGPRPPTMAPP